MLKMRIGKSRWEITVVDVKKQTITGKCIAGEDEGEERSFTLEEIERILIPPKIPSSPPSQVELAC